MSDDSGSKTEQPTPKKLRDARKKGNVAFSKDIPILSVTAGVLCFLYISMGDIRAKINELVLLSFSLFDRPIHQSIQIMYHKIIDLMLYAVVPLCAIAVLLASLSTVAHIGFVFTTSKLKLDFNNINPVNGFKKIFSKKTLVEAAKSLIISLILGYLCYIIILSDLHTILSSINLSVPAVYRIAKDIIINLLVICFVVYLIVAIIDFTIQRSFYIKKLMMSLDEIKKEFKETEGDPAIKAKRREIHQEIVNGNFVKNVSDSKVIITNPTRIAVGIAYQENTIPIPFVTIKGMGYKASVIRYIAMQYDVPIVESKYLARDLYSQIEQGEFISKSLFKAVAAVLAPLINYEKQQKIQIESETDKLDDINKI